MQNYNNYIKHIGAYKKIDALEKRKEVKEMKKEKEIRIGTVIFTRKKLNLNENDFKRLKDCYTKYSDEKELICEKHYFNLLMSTEKLESFGVVSYNKFIFTIGAKVQYNGKKYLLYITPSNNYFDEYKAN